MIAYGACVGHDEYQVCVFVGQIVGTVKIVSRSSVGSSHESRSRKEAQAPHPECSPGQKCLVALGKNAKYSQGPRCEAFVNVKLGTRRPLSTQIKNSETESLSLSARFRAIPLLNLLFAACCSRYDLPEFLKTVGIAYHDCGAHVSKNFTCK